VSLETAHVSLYMGPVEDHGQLYRGLWEKGEIFFYQENLFTGDSRENVNEASEKEQLLS